MKKIILLTILLLFAASATAHLDEGEDKVVGDILIDFGYSPENPGTNNLVTGSFLLFNEETGQPLAADLMILTITTTEQEIISNQTLSSNTREFSFEYAFPQQGSYELHTTFLDSQNTTIVEDSFTIEISAPVPPSLKKYNDLFGTVPFFIQIILIIALIAGIIILTRREKRKN